MRVLAFVGCIGALLAPLSARADYHVISPYEIDLGEIEIETNGSAVFDRRAEFAHAADSTIELGTGLTPWWHSEVELGFSRAPGDNQPTLLDSIVTENTFQLTEPGEYFADVGFYIEYGQSLTRGSRAGPNQVTFGPLIAKDIGRTTHTVNLLFTRLLGPDQQGNQGVDFSYAWQSRWNIWAPLSPAVEIYGDTGTLGATPNISRQEVLMGPVAVGALNLHALGLGNGGKFKYELGYLFGLTPATAHGTVRWRLELEIPF